MLQTRDRDASLASGSPQRKRPSCGERRPRPRPPPPRRTAPDPPVPRLRPPESAPGTESSGRLACAPLLRGHLQGQRVRGSPGEFAGVLTRSARGDGGRHYPTLGGVWGKGARFEIWPLHLAVHLWQSC